MGPVDDRTHFRSTVMKKSVFTAAVLLSLISRDRTCCMYHTRSHRFDTFCSALLLQGPNKTSDILDYFDLYKITVKLGIPSVFTAFTVHVCNDFRRVRVTVPHGLAMYEF